MTEDDELFGEECMTDGVYEALKHVPLAAVRHVFATANTSSPAPCDHHNAQLYRRKEWHYCPDCGKVVEHG